MDTEVTIAILKVASPLVTAALGILALLRDNRDPTTRKLTGWGVVTLLCGIPLTAMVGVSTSVFEAQKDRASSREQAARTEALLREINRSMQTIQKLKLRYWMDLPQENKVVAAYVRRMSAGVGDRLKLFKFPPPKFQFRDAPTKGLDAWATTANGEPLNVSITPESDLWPKDDDDAVGRAELLLLHCLSTFSKLLGMALVTLARPPCYHRRTDI
jgi:hypothetical protein